MRDIRDDTRTTWRTDDEREFERSQEYMDEPSGQWGHEGTRYGQPGYGYGQGSEGYRGGPGFGQGYQGGYAQGYQGSYGRGGHGRRHGSQGYRGYEPGSPRHWQQGSWRGPELHPDWRRRELGGGEYGGDAYGRDFLPEDDRSGQGWMSRSWTDRQGPFAGRGPKGYRRSDDRIREDVSDRLTDDDWFDASDVDVRVENGMVTLSGTVKSRDDKRRAEDMVMSVSGVKDVINQIHVDQGLLDQFAEAITGDKQGERTGEEVAPRR